ncbi:hypothetical protein FJY93_04640 [Candidatus Kaiserbacteria bacterium]|nr:hypothetical protein [Candidatus Kaiserbacteria bacterium]
MRNEEFGVGSIVHIMKRGAHKMPIVKDDADRWRFLKLLRYINDDNVPRNWERDISPSLIGDNFARPEKWPEAKPYVAILSYCLMENHFHVLLKELVDGGIAKFIQRLCQSMTSHHNAKYEASGTIFQGPYRAVVVEEDSHLQYLFAYINLKNPLELREGGLRAAMGDFDAAYEWAMRYPFSSTADLVGERMSSILANEFYDELRPHPQEFKAYARDVLLDRIARDENIARYELD